jgi:YbbR domain-containing protein
MKLRVPRIIRHDLPRKLVALFFALVIWLAVSAQLSQTMALHNVPVTLEHDADTIIEGDVPTVSVTVRGSPRSLELLNSTDIRLSARIDLVTPGVYFTTVTISPRNVTHTPPGVRVVDIDREKIQVKVDRIETKRNVPVTVRFEGDLRESFRRTRRAVVPASVDLRGPHRLLKEIEEVVTEPVLLDETVVQDFEQDAKLTTIPGVEPSTNVVHVTVYVARTSSSTAYQNLPMAVLAPPNLGLATTGELPGITVTIHGPQLALEKLSPQQIHPFVDLTAVKTAGQHTIPVQVWIDGDSELAVRLVHPATVPLVLVKQPAQTPAPKEPAAPTPDQKKPAEPTPKPDAPK